MKYITKLFPKDILLELMDLSYKTNITECGKYELIYESEWIDEGKYQNKEWIFKDLEDGKLYAIYDNKTGSYYSDMDYGRSYWDDKVECHLVDPREKIIIEYLPIKKV